MLCEEKRCLGDSGDLEIKRMCYFSVRKRKECEYLFLLRFVMFRILLRDIKLKLDSPPSTRANHARAFLVMNSRHSV